MALAIGTLPVSSPPIWSWLPGASSQLTKPSRLRLTYQQQNALDYVQVRAQLAEAFAREQLDQRAASLGFSARDVSRACSFIRDACPVIIHLKPEVIQLLNQDSHYRSQHETLTSGGALDLSYRDEKEALMFGGSYLTAGPQEKPKYGALNTLMDPLGVSSTVPRFGNCFLILKREVKLRCTLSGKGSKGGNVNLGTLDCYRHCLMDYDDDDLTNVMEVSKSWTESGCRHPPPISYRHSFNNATQRPYREAQIHGDIVLSRDIEALVLHPSYIDSQWVQEAGSIFARTHKVRVDRVGASRWP